MVSSLRSLISLVVLLAAVSCASGREFWSYVVDDKVSKPLPERAAGERDQQALLSPHNVKVVYNDGSTSTEVVVPVLTSGQQVVIDHKKRSSSTAVNVVPPVPTEADKSVEDAYVRSGQPVVAKAPAVSIVKTHGQIRELVREGNYSVALEYAEQILKKYPNHVETLRIKGSLLLKMGEREAALEAYRKAQDIEPDARVAKQIRDLEQALGNQP